MCIFAYAGLPFTSSSEWLGCSVVQSFLTLCDPMDCDPQGSSVPGILQARILEWAAFPSPGDLPDPGTQPESPELTGDSLPLRNPGSPGMTGSRSLRLRCNESPETVRHSSPTCIHTPDIHRYAYTCMSMYVQRHMCPGLAQVHTQHVPPEA